MTLVILRCGILARKHKPNPSWEAQTHMRSRSPTQLRAADGQQDDKDDEQDKEDDEVAKENSSMKRGGLKWNSKRRRTKRKRMMKI